MTLAKCHVCARFLAGNDRRYFVKCGERCEIGEPGPGCPHHLPCCWRCAEGTWADDWEKPEIVDVRALTVSGRGGWVCPVCEYRSPEECPYCGLLPHPDDVRAHEMRVLARKAAARQGPLEDINTWADRLADDTAGADD